MQIDQIVFMFSGQGSQYYQMGKELYEQNPVFRRWMQTLDQLVSEKTGFSVVDEIYNPAKHRGESFEPLKYTHPAIFMVEYALAQVFIEGGVEPGHVLGSSLGEYTAAAVAGAITANTALEMILKQVELFTKYCRPGGMLAIITGFDLYHRSPVLSDNSELAAVNLDNHFVITGERDKLQNVEAYLKVNNILFQKLPVPYGFHSTNINPIESEYIGFLRNFEFKKPEFSLMSCASGHRISEITPEHLWNAIRQPMNFRKALEELESDGDMIYIDLGPSGTLANFTKPNLSKDSRSQCFSILTPFGQDLKNLDKVNAVLNDLPFIVP